MGYAPHTNTDVQTQLRHGHKALPILLGQFVEREFGHTFEYSERQWPEDKYHPELQHVVYVGDGQMRLARVLKTVAYVLTNDDELQRWRIKSHKAYATDWIKA